MRATQLIVIGLVAFFLSAGTGRADFIVSADGFAGGSPRRLSETGAVEFSYPFGYDSVDNGGPESFGDTYAVSADRKEIYIFSETLGLAGPLRRRDFNTG